MGAPVSAPRQRRTIAGRDYELVVLHVVERDPDGSPRVFRLVRDDEEVNVSSGMEAFVTAWVIDGVLARKH